MRSLVLGLTITLGLALAATPAAGAARRPPTRRPKAEQRDGGPGAGGEAQGHRARPPVGRPADRRRPADLHPARPRHGVDLGERRQAGHRAASRAASVWVSGETGLMGLDVDPGFADNRRFYTCQGGTHRGRRPRRPGDGLDARRRARPRITPRKKLLGGLPATSGRHGGCRLLALGDGSLLVGTGDAAVGTNPREPQVPRRQDAAPDATTGAPWPDEPVHQGRQPQQALRLHLRPPQRAGPRPAPATARSGRSSRAPTATTRSTGCATGGDYGYNPVPGYNESVPMTDQALPGKQWNAVWRSGDPTIATSGGGFVNGKAWGAYDGTLRRRRARRRAGGLPELVQGRQAAQGADPDGPARATAGSAPWSTDPARSSTSPPTTAAATTRSSRCARAASRSRGPAEPRPAGGHGREPEHDREHRDPRHPRRVRGPPRARDARAAAPRRRAAARPPTRGDQPARGVQEERARHPGHPDERPGRHVRVAARSPSRSGHQFVLRCPTPRCAARRSPARPRPPRWVGYGPSRSIGGHMSSPCSTRWCFTQNQKLAHAT